jgi:hypothetical protein
MVALVWMYPAGQKLQLSGEDCPGRETALLLQLVAVFWSGQKDPAGHGVHWVPEAVDRKPSLHMQTPWLIAALAGHTHWSMVDDPGGETLDGGHLVSSPPWQ